VELQVNTFKVCVRHAEMDQMEYARDNLFWIYDLFLTSPSSQDHQELYDQQYSSGPAQSVQKERENSGPAEVVRTGRGHSRPAQHFQDKKCTGSHLSTLQLILLCSSFKEHGFIFLPRNHLSVLSWVRLY
jgi:hypothetical protein